MTSARIPTVWRAILMVPLSACWTLLLAGCVSDRHIALSYESDLPEMPNKSVEISLVKLKDGRTSPTSVVGAVYDKQMVQRAKVYADDADIAGWISNAIASDLTACGFKVLKCLRYDQARTHIVITGKVREVFDMFTVDHSAVIEVEITIHYYGKMVKKIYKGIGTYRDYWGTAGAFEQSLGRALRNMSLQIKRDVENLSE